MFMDNVAWYLRASAVLVMLTTSTSRAATHWEVAGRPVVPEPLPGFWQWAPNLTVVPDLCLAGGDVQVRQPWQQAQQQTHSQGELARNTRRVYLSNKQEQNSWLKASHQGCLRWTWPSCVFSLSWGSPVRSVSPGAGGGRENFKWPWLFLTEGKSHRSQSG